MKCNICRVNEENFDVPTKSHLVITKNQKDGHIHVHGDINAKENMKEMLDTAAEEIGVSLKVADAQTLPKEVVFHNRQRIGDMLVFTCGVRDFKAAFPHIRVNVVATAMHIFDHNPNIDRTLVATPENTIKIGPSKLTNASNRLDWHFCNAFRVSIEDALKVQIPQGESRPDIYLTQEEYDAPRVIRDPYWIICTNGEKGWGTKMYPHVKWQEVVDQNPDLLFVQIGTKEDNAPRLVGPNVIDYIGKTQSKDEGIRDLFKLFLNAEGSIGLVSFHMHLSGALSKPAIIVAGAREPVHFTRYPGHAYLATDGMLPCATKACWHCSIDACTNLVTQSGEKVPKCVDIITSQDVTRAIAGFYQGGRLIKGTASVKPKLKNIVPTPLKVEKVEEVIIPVADQCDDNTYGMTFGGGSLTSRDWNFIKSVIEKYDIKSILEFGAGLSTLLLNDVCKDVHTMETNQGWIDKIQNIKPCLISQWEGKKFFKMSRQFDLCFVDGPAGDIGREYSTAMGAEYGNVVIVHDAGREYARKYQDQYLKPGFDGPFKGGHRCHLWVKKGLRKEAGVEMCAIETIVDSSPIITQQKGIVAPTKSKSVKIVSTARGWGGCARSVTTIIDMLLKGGHKVEFIPFRNAVTSSEWKVKLSHELKDCKVTPDYSTLQEACDVLLVYADDFVWDFKLPEIAEAFSNIGADRKIMMSNFRNGGIGVIPWTKGWDKYMFLNSTQEKDLLKVLPGVKTKVLPPCTDLKPFFKVKADYENGIRIVRHSSQGDTKFSKDFLFEVTAMQFARTDLKMSFLPGASFLPVNDYINKIQRTADPNVIAEFLGTGNLFWYSLPAGYMDMGPRVILEAMAAGLPILADNWGGAVDRVTGDTGWLCNTKEEHVEIIKSLTATQLRAKGELARQRAYEEFRPEAWLRELLS